MNIGARANEAEILASLEAAGAYVEESGGELVVFRAWTEERVRLAAQLARMKKLHGAFSASGPILAGPEVRHLKGHKNLRDLDITNVEISGEDLAVVATLPKLEVLRCTPKEKVSEAMAAIAKCKRLRVLSLDGSNLSDEDCASLRSLVDLEELSLSNNPISSGVAVVSGMKRLRKIVLEVTLVNDDTLAALRGLDQLEELFIGSPQVTNRVITHLKQCSRLETLGIQSPKVTGECARDLIELASLQSIYLGETRADTAMLKVLANAKSLKSLLFSGDAVSSEDREKFEALLPKCNFIWFEYPDNKKSK